MRVYQEVEIILTKSITFIKEFFNKNIFKYKVKIFNLNFKYLDII
jgi:hypothetical protein